jgi:hypothetical protein
MQAENAFVGGRGQSVSYGNGMWVAVGRSGIWMSPNGTKWGQPTNTTPFVGGTGYSVAYANNVWVAVGYNGIWRSNDAASWIQSSNAFDGGTGYSVAYGNGVWVAVGDGIWTSGDGVEWTQQKTEMFACIAYADGRWVAVGEPGIIESSDDGLSWNLSTGGAFAGNGGQSITYANDMWVASASSSDGLWFSSPCIKISP